MHRKVFHCNEKFRYILNSFKERFKELQNSFNDRRKAEFHNINEKRTFDFIRTSPHYYFSVSWTQDLIEVIYNKDLIMKNFYYQVERDSTFLKKYFIQCANHEYGHTITCSSAFKYIIPKDVRHMLIKKKLKQISYNNLNKCLENSKSEFIRLLNLKNIDIALFQRIFLDYWANFKVYEIIDDTPPGLIIEDRYAFLSSKNNLSANLLLNPEAKRNENIYRLLLYTGEFFIFNKWKLLVKLFKSKNLDKLLDLYRYINSFFHEIIELNDDFDIMQDDLVVLAKLLENVNYNKIILRNFLHSEVKEILLNYIKYLKYKRNL